MHVHAHEVAAVLSGVLLSILAFMPRIGLGDRLVSGFVGVAFVAYGVYTAVAVDQVELPPYVFAVPFITVLWLLGGMRGPVQVNIAAEERRSVREQRSGRKHGSVREHKAVRGHGSAYPAELLLSPALWAELPPPPISPAAGVPVPTAPREAGTYPARAALAPPAESLFTPAMPPASAHRVCGACGRCRDDGATFCGGCGKPFLAYAPALATAPVRPGVRTIPVPAAPAAWSRTPDWARTPDWSRTPDRHRTPPPPTVPTGLRAAERAPQSPIARHIELPAEKPQAAPASAPVRAPERAPAEPMPELAPLAPRPISPTYRLRNLRGEYEPPSSIIG